MTLKFKRNLPLLLLLTGILLLMALGMGNQIITSYTVTPAAVQAWAAHLSQLDLTNSLAAVLQ